MPDGNGIGGLVVRENGSFKQANLGHARAGTLARIRDCQRGMAARINPAPTFGTRSPGLDESSSRSFPKTQWAEVFMDPSQVSALVLWLEEEGLARIFE